MVSVSDSHLVLGTQIGELWLCDASSRKANVLFASFSDAVTCVNVVKRCDSVNLVNTSLRSFLMTGSSCAVQITSNNTTKMGMNVKSVFPFLQRTRICDYVIFIAPSSTEDFLGSQALQGFVTM